MYCERMLLKALPCQPLFGGKGGLYCKRGCTSYAIHVFFWARDDRGKCIEATFEGRLKLSTIPHVQQPGCGAGLGRLSGNKLLNNSEKRICIPAL